MISLAVILLLGFETLVGTKMVIKFEISGGHCLEIYHPFLKTPKEYYPLAENRLHDGIFDGAELILRQEILEERRYPAIPKQRSLRSEKMESGPEGRIKCKTVGIYYVERQV